MEKVVSSSTAEAGRKKISSSVKEQSGSIERKRGSYEKITPAKKVKIAKYAAENGIAAAIRHFKTEKEYSQIDLKESTVRGWKKFYCDTLSSKSRMGDDKPVMELPAQSVGHPLLLGQNVEEKTRVIHQIREAGGVINNSVVIGIITGSLHDTESSLLLENGGPIHVDKAVARCLLSRMQFLGDIRSVIILESIPERLIII